MAPLIRLAALFALALATSALASPHVPRHAYNHAHRAIALPSPDVPPPPPLALPRRKRSLNKRCVPRPANSTTSAVPTSTAPINVAPVPSLLPSSSSPSPSAADTTSSTSSYTPPSSTTQAPSPSPTTQAPSPSPTTQAPSPSPSTSSTPAPAQTSSSSNSGEPSYMTGTQSGAGTWYETGLGACGITNNDSQNIVAVSESLFDTYPGYDGVNPNTNPVCGKSITASYEGKSVTVTVTDRCTGCQTTDLDFSPNAFDTLAAASVGRIDITWDWS